MEHKNSKSISLRIFGFAALIIALTELLLCFTGPIAFIPKPSLVLFPVVSSNLSEEESSIVTDLIEREMAFMKSYAIVSRNFIEEYFIRTNPPIRPIVKITTRILKYLSINDLIEGPKYQINPETRKKRADRLIAETKRKTPNFISNAPAAIVNTLYGIGVNPAMPTAHASYC